jgi:L-alanine-DL-glutamate epimerase-like enolase superfamily enzyme
MPFRGKPGRARREALAGAQPYSAFNAGIGSTWNVRCRCPALRASEPSGPDFVEQPVPRWDLEGLAHIGRSVSVPVMADESCFTLQDAMTLARLGGVSILGLKLTKSAGIIGAMAIARVAEAAGLGAHVGCMIETSHGTAAYLALAVTAPPVTWGCELSGPLLLAGDVVRRPAQYADGAEGVDAQSARSRCGRSGLVSVAHGRAAAPAERVGTLDAAER